MFKAALLVIYEMMNLMIVLFLGTPDLGTACQKFNNNRRARKTLC